MAMASPGTDLYSSREIGRAAGVSEADVRAALGGRRGYASRAEAVRIGRALARAAAASTPGFASPAPLFSIFQTTRGKTTSSKGIPFALSSGLHAGTLAAAIFMTTLGLSPTAATSTSVDVQPGPMHLVFLAVPGPGGGGGGGGLLQKTPPPKAEREGHRSISSPLPRRRPPKPIEPIAAPPEPKPEPPLEAEPLPVVFAPIVTAPADMRDRIGVLEQTTAQNDSHGPGQGGGTGRGVGTGIGAGDGAGVGAGSGGGTGGGPYRPGSGIDPPRLLREVRADYTEEARLRGLSGEVLLEIVVRHDGSVGAVTILQGLDSGLNDRAVQAVRQWRFSPARRQGTPVDVIVEVAVEFRLR